MIKRDGVILVVEDEPLIRMSAVDLVESEGFEAVEAADADEAIRILEARSDIRLVFTDIDMPGSMDGMKLSRYVRSRWPPVKLILASGKTIPGVGNLPDGAQFFHKPYVGRTVADAIVRMLRD